MHELSIAESILEILEEHRRKGNFRRIVSVRLEAGALSGIDSHALEFAFDAIRQGTCAQNAALTIDRQRALLTCYDCGHHETTAETAYCCPNCHSINIKIDGETELYILSLEAE